MIEIGQKHTSELTVTDAVTAIAVGSGDMPVLATPMMMALMENAAMLAVKNELPEGSTTVGGHIESSHLKPSKIGDVVKATAEVTAESNTFELCRLSRTAQNSCAYFGCKLWRYSLGDCPRCLVQ